jgi:calcium-dependent protein kinase
MEFCEGGDIFDKIDRCGKVSEKYAAKVMKYLLIGVNYLHGKMVVHRDIKPENILITNKASFKDLSIKIIDFNIAIIKYDKTLKGVSGTTDYMAPEVFSGVYNEKCDLWSCGVVLYLMVSGQLPFPSTSDEETEKAIKTEKLTFPSPYFDSVSPTCKDFLSKLLNKNPRSRPSAQEALSHPWLSLCDDAVDKRLISCTLKRMQTNSSSSKLKEVFTTFIISQISKSSSYKKFEQIFFAIDVDKNGVISYEELVKQFSLEMSRDQAEEKAAKMLSLVDNDGNGEIEFTEFLRAAVDHDTLLNKENLRKAFCYFDKDGSNAIEKHELVEWLSAGGMIPDDIVQELMQEADVNGDGIIDIHEFENLLVNKLEI